ncbi:TrbG/VirB9 family P-type conjugative transfer protein [Variovorax sp. RB2P76]|uniref:TrbG/VirB9 family P-type conjugative transfer protein n=2 Tax=unclassified Variovorax TaxID=663243 RepID=UPI003F4854D8
MLMAVLALSPQFAGAEVGTLPSGRDARIQTVRYTNNDVIRIFAAEGVATTIELAAGEQITDFAMGDRDAWHAAVNGNLFLVKPKDVRADTNLTLFTSRRAYLFVLRTTARTARNVAYWVRLEYPGDAQSGGADRAQAARLQIHKDLSDAALEGRLNKDYWIVGARELQPLAMHDNGRQTFMTFSAAHALPAAFVIEPDGGEGLVDFHVEGDTMVLHRVVERLLLRRGSLVAGITNRSPGSPTESPPGGTVSDKVQRVIRAPGG